MYGGVKAERKYFSTAATSCVWNELSPQQVDYTREEKKKKKKIIKTSGYSLRDQSCVSVIRFIFRSVSVIPSIKRYYN